MSDTLRRRALRGSVPPVATNLALSVARSIARDPYETLENYVERQDPNLTLISKVDLARLRASANNRLPPSDLRSRVDSVNSKFLGGPMDGQALSVRLLEEMPTYYRVYRPTALQTPVPEVSRRSMNTESQDVHQYLLFVYQELTEHVQFQVFSYLHPTVREDNVVAYLRGDVRFIGGVILRGGR